VDKFNLTFDGKIVSGFDLAEVKKRFAEALLINDPARVDQFFSGTAVTIRRNLDKDIATAFYTKMYRVGVVLKLEQAHSKPANETSKPNIRLEFREQRPGRIDQSWPIPSSNPRAKKTSLPPISKPGNAVKQAEDNERKQAAEERNRIRDEEAARIEAEALAAEKRAAEEVAKAQAEEKRKRDEAAAHVKAEQERRQTEEIAKRKAEALIAEQKAAEEVAKVLAEKKRKRDKEAAERKAEALAAKKKAAEDAARAKEERKREEEASRAQAEKDAQLAAEKKRVLAQEIARQEAEKAEEAAATQQALELAASKQAKEQEARLRTELAAQKRKNAQEAARAKADEERIEDALRTLAAKRKAEETKRNLSLKEDKQRQLELEEAENRQQRRVQERQMEQAALQRAAADRARLEESQRASGSRREAGAKKTPHTSAVSPALAGGKRQPGAPNLFNLKPFRNTAEIRQRATSSFQLMKIMYIASVVTLLTLLILGARYALLPTPSAGVTHIDKIIANQHSALFIAAGAELFVLDRSGTDNKRYRFTDLRIEPGSTPLDFDHSGNLLFQNQPATDTDTDEASSAPRLLRCDLQIPKCEAFAADIPKGKISDWITDIRTGDSFVAITGENSLSRLAQDGSLISQQTVTMSSGAKLIFHGGLLYMNSSTDPAIGVFRPDAKSFGEQLDDILLLPQQAQEQGHTQIIDFLWSADSWWVIMANPDTHSSGLYRFDADWKHLSAMMMEPQSLPQQLLAWSNKILVVDRTKVDIRRFNADGQAELPLTPKALASDITRKQTSLTQSRRLWYACLGFLALLGIVTYVLGRFHQLRALVYKHDKVRGAEPIDDKVKAIRWIELDRRNNAVFKQLAALLAAITIMIIGMLVYQVAPINVVMAAIIFSSGPAIALTLMTMSRPGHIGVLGDKLILVDHNNNYHIDGGARIHYRNNFLLLDDIAVYIGNKRLPVFSTEQLAQNIVPLASAGVKVDRKTILVKLGQSSHPLTRGLIACTVCLGGALFCLLLY
jgi:hypothetical protein